MCQPESCSDITVTITMVIIGQIRAMKGKRRDEREPLLIINGSRMNLQSVNISSSVSIHRANVGTLEPILGQQHGELSVNLYEDHADKLLIHAASNDRIDVVWDSGNGVRLEFEAIISEWNVSGDSW